MKRLDEAGFRRSVAALTAADPDLAAVVERYGPPPFWRRPPGFTTLVRIVLEQQVSLRSAKAIFDRLATAAAPLSPVSLRELGEAGLRAHGLTRQKARYCAGLAEEVAAGRLDLAALAALPDGEARQALLRIPGVGPWTAEIYLLSALCRPDVWPPGDLALARAAREVKRLPSPPSAAELAALAEGWHPWRASAARLLWHAYLRGAPGPA